MLLAGCAGFGPTTPTLPPAATSTIPAPPETPAPQPSLEAPATAESQPEVTTLTVWLPPQFDPQSGSPAGALLQERLEDFETREGIQIEVRLKAESGQASLLESLAAAKPAAPGALPDLIALDRASLESAALKGLITPYDEYNQEIDSPDWFEYARQMGILQGSSFGLPFAGDALVLVSRAAKVRDGAASWENLVRLGVPAAFAAADPLALATLALYQSTGGSIHDTQGRPVMDAGQLARVLEVYQQAAANGVFPQWIASLESEDQAWKAYQEERADLAVVWMSTYLRENPPDTAVQPLLPVGDVPVSLAQAWSWALASPDPVRRETAAHLAVFLADGQFLARWSEAAGTLPTRPTSLAAWTSQGRQALLSQVILSARAEPNDELLLVIGPVLKDAVLQVIQSGADPGSTAEAAARRLNTP